MGAFSDDETSKDSQSLSSRGSARGRVGTYSVYIGEIMCGAIFTMPHTGERQYVCFNKASCRRPEHKALARCSLHGYLFCLTKTKNKYIDGALDSAISDTEYQGILEEGFSSNRAALRSYAARQPDSQPHPEPSNTPSSHSGPLTAWQHVPPPVAPPMDRKPPSRTDHPGPPTNRGQVSFTSPVTLPYADGHQAAARTIAREGSPPTLGLKTSPSEGGEGLSAAQLALARQLLGTHIQESTQQGTPPRASKSGKDSKKAKSRKSSSSRSRNGRSKGRKSHRKKRASSSSSSSDSEASTDSGSGSDPSGSSGSSSTRSPTYWYAVVFGLDGRDVVTRDKRMAKSLCTPGWLYRRLKTQTEAWEFVDRYRKLTPNHGTPPRTADFDPLPAIPEYSGHATLPQLSPADQVPAQGPGLPPMVLSGRDKSAKTEDEIFGISLDTDATHLQKLLAPPGVTARAATDLSECLLDAVALPGKTGQSTESEDVVANLQISLEEIGRISRQEQLGDQQRRDLKWSQPSRNALRTVKKVEDLRTLMLDVLSLKDRTLNTITAWQKTLLGKEPWEKIVQEAWSGSGYYTVLSRKSLEHYLSLLEHLMELAREYPWDMVQQEIDYYVQKWVLIRNNSQQRIMAMCHIYVTLRDGAARNWITPKLEAKKLLRLYRELQTTTGQAGDGSGSPTLPGAAPGCCSHCGTVLHGNYPCAWASATPNKAKDRGRAALRNIANGARANTPTGAAGNQEG